jgi:hypothetical protein
VVWAEIWNQEKEKSGLERVRIFGFLERNLSVVTNSRTKINEVRIERKSKKLFVEMIDQRDSITLADEIDQSPDEWIIDL